jgi:Ca2+-binding EF-hand superfamily protein
MLNLSKVMVFFIVLLGATHLFAQVQDMQTPEEQADSNEDQTFQKGKEVRNNRISLGFQKIETDQDGFISPNEWQVYSDGAFKQMDTDQDGKISEDEYADYCKLLFKTLK